MSPQAVAHFERKGWPLRPYCCECSAKARTAAAQQKQLERQRAANNVEQRRAPEGGPSAQGRNCWPVSTVRTRTNTTPYGTEASAAGVKWGARVLRVRLVSREEVWA